jgi:ATP-binding cassette subfamily B multidrug efflux pump
MAWYERLIDPLPNDPVVRPPESVFAFYVAFVRPVKWLVLAVLILSGIAAVIEMGLLVFMGWLVDWMTITPPAEFFATHGVQLIVMAGIVLLLRPSVAILNRTLNNLALVPGLTARVRWLNYRYVLRQSLTFFHNDFAGRIAQKVLQTGPALRDTVITLIDNMWTFVVYIVGMVVLFGRLDLYLLIPVGVWAIAYILTGIRFVPKIKVLSSAQAEANSVLSGRIVDSYTNIQSVKLFAHADREDQFAREGFERQIRSYREFAGWMANMMVTLMTLNGALIVAVSALSIWLWSEGLATVGGIAVATSLVIRLNQMANMTMRNLGGLFEEVGLVQNGVQTISRANVVVDAPEAKPLVVTNGEIRFENVRFHYGRESGVIEDFTLTVKPGEKVGIVGRSGAGKSTLVNLLLRFYDLQGGRILIDGQDIAHVTQESLREKIGMVTQDTSLLHRSVKDNIRYGRPGASEDEMIAAARRAEAHDFILNLKDYNSRTGYNAHVGERGVKLSGGQRQRVAIARLILKDAPILVLDEATSALDSEVEAAIQSSLYGLMEGRTVIAIAHRLSTIAVLDRLVVMDEGRIVEIGSHAELLDRDGLYASLWRRQSGGFLGLEPVVERATAAAAE